MQDYRETPQGKWRIENPEFDALTTAYQVSLQKIGIAWHNPLADECTNDFGCCTNNGDYKIRVNQYGRYRTGIREGQDPRIGKSELVHNGFYLNANATGIRVGKWDGAKEKFLCIKGPRHGFYTVCEMPHFEDAYRTIFFEPMERLV